MRKKKVYSIVEFLFLCCLFLTHDCAAVSMLFELFFSLSKYLFWIFFPPFLCVFSAPFDVWNFFKTKTFFLKFLCVYYFSFLMLLKLNFYLWIFFVFLCECSTKTKIKTKIVQLNKKRGSKFRILTEIFKAFWVFRD